MLEIGSAGVGSGDTYLNFHSSGNNINYDSKIVSTGGGATSGSGTLSLIANIIKLGSATSPSTFIQNSDSLVIGQTPSSYDGVNYMSAPGMRFQNVNNFCRFDFHCI